MKKEKHGLNQREAATKDSWKTLPMPAKHVTVPMDIPLTAGQMANVRLGHIPMAMEDHWFMYCTDSRICYHRSWTGYCIFEADYEASGDGFRVTGLTINTDPEQHTATPEEAEDRFRGLLSSSCRED